MPTICLRFPGGRYHATPWGHHVNEGQIEWPPSPWRLLRALIATGYATQQWDEIPPVGRSLFESLAGVLPCYELPSASSAHSRHYIPVGKLDKNMEKTTLVFDTWANVGDGELKIRWDCTLTDEERELFQVLVEQDNFNPKVQPIFCGFSIFPIGFGIGLWIVIEPLRSIIMISSFAGISRI